jgi:diguanylate cyclase (GGDEF)-like protein
VSRSSDGAATKAGVGRASTSLGDRYEIVNEIGAMLTSSLVLDDVLTRVAQGIGKALDVWECDLYEYSAATNTLTAKAVWVREPTREDEEWVGTVVDLTGRPSYHEVLHEGRLTEDHLDDPGLDPADKALMERWGELSTLSVPLRFRDEIIGCLVLVEKRRPRRFTEGEKDLLRELAVPAAIAIHNARLFFRQQEQARHLASLLDSGKAITSTVVLEDVLQMVARKAAEALGTQESSIYEYDGQRDVIRRVGAYATGQSEEEARSYLGREFAVSEWPTNRRALETRAPVQEAVSDPATDPAARAVMLEFGQRSTLTVPFVLDNEPVGIVELVESGFERRFTEAEIELARGLGEQAAVAIANAKLFKREELRNQRLVTLLEASRSIAASLKLQAVLERLSAEIVDLLADEGTDVDVRLRNEDGGYAPFSLLLGDEGGEGEVAPPDVAARRALAALEAVQVTREEETRLVVPLVVEGSAEGYIEVVAPGRRAYEHDELELLQIVASQAAVAFENARLYDRIEQQAITDGLTGLYNHRYFYKRLGEEVATSERYGAPLSLLMLDLDDFKRFNDTYGHLAGDLVLREIADILRHQVRNLIDLPARYGGEEFAVILPNTPLSGAQAAADRLRQRLTVVRDADGEAVTVGGDGDLPAGGGGVAPAAEDSADTVGERIRRNIATRRFEGKAGRRHVHLTVSIGIASYPEHCDDAESLVNCADKALYLAKRMGKNRVETFG